MGRIFKGIVSDIEVNSPRGGKSLLAVAAEEGFGRLRTGFKMFD